MYRTMKMGLFSLCLIISVVSGTVMNAAAATNLPESFLIGDHNGIHVNYEGDYYISAEDVLPGDVICKTLTIQNLEVPGKHPAAHIPYHLSMTMEPISTTGPVDLLDTRLELVLDGKNIYNGTIRGKGDDGINVVLESLALGEYKPGDQRTLEITMVIDSTYDPVEWKVVSEAIFKWHFYAYRTENREPPKTGILDTYGVYLLIFGGTATLFMILVFLKKRHVRKRRQDIANL